MYGAQHMYDLIFPCANACDYLLLCLFQVKHAPPIPALLSLTVCVVPEQWLLSFSDTLIVRDTYLPMQFMQL